MIPVLIRRLSPETGISITCRVSGRAFRVSPLTGGSPGVSVREDTETTFHVFPSRAAGIAHIEKELTA